MKPDLCLMCGNQESGLGDPDISVISGVPLHAIYTQQHINHETDKIGIRTSQGLTVLTFVFCLVGFLVCLGVCTCLHPCSHVCACICVWRPGG